MKDDKEEIIETTVEHGAVIYTDGSALPNGFYGTGIHGYMYDLKGDSKHGDKPNNISITDIGYLHKDILKRSTYVNIKPLLYIDAAISYAGIGTNNMAELLGAILGIKFLLNHDYNVKKITIISDSEYVFKVCRLVMRDNEWITKKDVPNYGLRVEIHDVLTRCEDEGVEVILQDVKGHSGDFGNELSDRLAYIGRQRSLKGDVIAEEFILSKANRYWKYDIEKNPLIDYKQLFFTNDNRKHLKEYLYAILEYKSDVELGKKTNTATFGLVKLKQRVDVIENVISKYLEGMETLSILSTANLNEVYKQKHLFFNNYFKDACYNFDYKRHRLNFIEEVDVVTAINPPGLANQAMTRTLELNQILNTYHIGKSDDYRQFIDITDSIYELNEKKKKICKIPNGINELLVTVDDFTFPIILGVDTLSRNQFNKYLKDDIKVTLVVDKPDERYIEYYTVVDVKSRGDIGIYCNFYSNKFFLKVKKLTKKKKKK